MKALSKFFALVGAVLTGSAVSAATFYASPTGGGDGSSAESPATLAAAITAASAAGAGSVVQLADGIYEQTAQITIAADITVQGASREGTVVTKKASTEFRLFTLNSAGAVLKDMTVENGFVKGSGGNILIETGGGLVQNCVIRNGAAQNNGNGGGGIALKGGEVVDSVITNNTFDAGNQYEHSCGAVFFVGCSQAAIRRCVVARNFAKSSTKFVATAGIGVYNGNAKGVVIDSCTIAFNSGSRSGGIYSGTAGTIVTNCLFTGNISRRASPGYRDFYNGLSNMKVMDCCFDADAATTGTDATTGLIVLDPVTYVPTFDSANVGKARDGRDIGAVQHETVAAAMCYVLASQTQGVTGTDFTFTAHATDVAGNEPTSCIWDFGDGATDSGLSVTHAYATAGTYAPKATVVIGGVSAEGAVSVDVGASDLYVTPADDLKAVVDAARPGATVHVAPGTYSLATAGASFYDVNGNSALVLNKPVRVIADSANPDDTVIRMTKAALRAFYLNDSEALVSGFTLREGSLTAAQHFGALLLMDNGTVSNCVMTAGVANGNGTGGAGVGLHGGLVTHCVISNNTSTITLYDNNGGAVNVYGGTVRNCLICNNVGNNSSGKFVNVGGVSMSDGTLESCTVAGNSGPGCGGVWVRANSAKVLNCAIYGNTSVSSTPSDAQWRANGGCFNYCVSPVAITSGKNCIVGTVNSSGRATGDWRPLVGSATIGAGSVQDWMADAADLDGNPMIADGKTDVGCYQYQASYISGFLNVDVAEGVLPLTVALTAEGTCVDPITAYEWTFGDGATETTATPTTTHTYTGIGSFKPSVRLIVASTGKFADVALANEISVGNAHFYVTAQANPSAAFPWDSWENAATNIAEVIPYALNTAVITLSEGTHLTDSQIALTRGVTVEGAGMEETVVAAREGSANHRMFLLNHADARVCSLTAQGTGVHLKDSHGSVVLVESFGGTVSNCVIRGGLHDQNGYAGAGILLFAGKITHSILRDNAGGCTAHGYDHSGGTLCLWGPDAIAEYCLVTSNRTWCGTNGGGSSGGIVMLNNGGKIRNSSIVGNYAGNFSGDPVHAGYAGVTTVGASTGNEVVNCLIADNASEGESVSELRRVANAGAIAVMDHCATDVDVGRAAAGCTFGDMLFRGTGSREWWPRFIGPAGAGALITDEMVGATYLDGTPVPAKKAAIGCYPAWGAISALMFIVH